MLLDICREETCRRLRDDQRDPHPGHGGATLPVEVELGPVSERGGRAQRLVTRTSGVIWPADVTLVDLAAEGAHGGGTVEGHDDAASAVTVAFYVI
jgi:hypothetical protein